MHITAANALAQLEQQREPRSIQLFSYGTLRVKLYAPRGHDPQQPHSQDEIYVIASGSGMFWNGEERIAFAAGDLLFVPAGIPHRFEDFTDDFSTWVMFYGPEGGERP